MGMMRRARSKGTAIFRRPQWSHHAVHRLVGILSAQDRGDGSPEDTSWRCAKVVRLRKPHEQTCGLLPLGLPEPEACDDVARWPHTRFSGQRNEAKMPTPFRNILR